jgi:ATP-dependent Clp protease ATP-binding subunit ClpA
MAKNSKLDPVIGREEEIRRTLQMYLLIDVIANCIFF